MVTEFRTSAPWLGEGGIRLKLPGPGGPEGGLEPNFVAYVFVFPDSIVDCTNRPFQTRPQVTLQLTVRLSHLVQIFLVGPPLLGEPAVGGFGSEIWRRGFYVLNVWAYRPAIFSSKEPRSHTGELESGSACHSEVWSQGVCSFV
jgi:hypothetical protein